MGSQRQLFAFPQRAECRERVKRTLAEVSVFRSVLRSDSEPPLPLLPPSSSSCWAC